MGERDAAAILALAETLAADALDGMVVSVPQLPGDAERIREAVLAALVEATGGADGCAVEVEAVGLDGAVRLTVDGTQDVLYAKRTDGIVKNSAEAPNDDYLILNFAADGSVIGIQVIEAHGLIPDEWKRHPDRGLVPPDILEEVDRWFTGEDGAVHVRVTGPAWLLGCVDG